MAEESLILLEQIEARHAVLNQHEAQSRNYETVGENPVPAGMEAHFNPPRHYDLWALDLEVRVSYTEG